MRDSMGLNIIGLLWCIVGELAHSPHAEMLGLGMGVTCMVAALVLRLAEHKP